MKAIKLAGGAQGGTPTVARGRAAEEDCVLENATTAVTTGYTGLIGMACTPWRVTQLCPMGLRLSVWPVTAVSSRAVGLKASIVWIQVAFHPGPPDKY